VKLTPTSNVHPYNKWSEMPQIQFHPMEPNTPQDLLNPLLLENLPKQSPHQKELFYSPQNHPEPSSRTTRKWQNNVIKPAKI